jgi:hypothetical protein
MTERNELTAAPQSPSDERYVAPAITPLGHLAELTLLGSGGLDELENDGSVA